MTDYRFELKAYLPKLRTGGLQPIPLVDVEKIRQEMWDIFKDTGKIIIQNYAKSEQIWFKNLLTNNRIQFEIYRIPDERPSRDLYFSVTASVTVELIKVLRITGFDPNEESNNDFCLSESS